MKQFSIMFKMVFPQNWWQLQMLLLFWRVICTDSARILGIFAIPVKSHFVYNDSIMRILVSAGHQVTVVSPFPPESLPENYTAIDISKECFPYVGRSSLEEFMKYNIYDLVTFLASVEEEYCYTIMKNKQIQELLHSEHPPFDVIFLEIFLMYDCFSPLIHKHHTPVIGTASQRFWLFSDQIISNPSSPAHIPSDFALSWRQENFRERLINVWRMAFVKLFGNHVVSSKLARFRKQTQEMGIASTETVIPSLLFYNGHPIFFPRPLNPNVIEIGGVHVAEERPVPKDIEQFISESPKGVILFTLGSIYRGSSLSAEAVLAFKEAFAEIPLRVIWKFEDQMDNVPNNVLLTQWVPQRDVLAHRNVKAFISHCGLLGIYEAISTGTPVIATPIIGDQHSNAAILENLGVAVHLGLTSVTKEDVTKALDLIVNDTKYYERMQQLSAEFVNWPLKPRESILYWTEYVIRHNGAPFLQPAASKLYWFQYFSLDVFLFVGIIIFVPLYTVKLIFMIICFHGRK